jgi:hypothetical protein
VARWLISSEIWLFEKPSGASFIVSFLCCFSNSGDFEVLTCIFKNVWQLFYIMDGDCGVDKTRVQFASAVTEFERKERERERERAETGASVLNGI